MTHEICPRVFFGAVLDATRGEWVELPETIETVAEKMRPHLRMVDGEEWIAADAEGFGYLSASEVCRLSPATICALADFLSYTDADDARLLAFTAFLSNEWDADFSVAWDRFEDAYRGEWDSVEDYAEDFVRETTDLRNVPDFIAYHIDWAGIGRDLVLGGDIYAIESDAGVFIFSNH